MRSIEWVNIDSDKDFTVDLTPNSHIQKRELETHIRDLCYQNYEWLLKEFFQKGIIHTSLESTKFHSFGILVKNRIKLTYLDIDKQYIKGPISANFCSKTNLKLTKLLWYSNFQNYGVDERVNKSLSRYWKLSFLLKLVYSGNYAFRVLT